MHTEQNFGLVLHCLMVMPVSTCNVWLLQLGFQNYVPLRSSDSRLQDKRAYHTIVLGQGHDVKKGLLPVEGRLPSRVNQKLQ